MKRIKKLLFFLFLVVLAASPLHSRAAEYSLVVSIRHDLVSNKLSLDSIKLAKGESPTSLYQPKDGHILKLLSQDGSTLYETRFAVVGGPTDAPPREWFDSSGRQVYFPEKPVGAERPKERIFAVIVPYLIEASTLEVDDPAGMRLFSRRIDEAATLAEDIVQRDIDLVVHSPVEEGREVSPLLFVVPSVLLVVLLACAVYLYKRKTHIPARKRAE